MPNNKKTVPFGDIYFLRAKVGILLQQYCY